MTNRPVKFATVARVLEELGFTLKTVKDSHRLFTHAGTGATLLLPLRGADLRPAFVKAIGRTLDERGLMQRDEFESRLAPALAGRGKVASNGLGGKGSAA